MRDGDWIEIPACHYRVGLENDEIDRVAEISAARAQRGVEAVTAGLGKELLGAIKYYSAPLHVREELKRTSYAYDVEIPTFAIARRPVTNAQFRRFIAEVGGPDPEGWQNGKIVDDEPVRGVAWSRAAQFAAWAGARLPFEAEWERAARGPERRYFPWGNDDAAMGYWTGPMRGGKFHRSGARATATPDGIELLVTGNDFEREWCADPRPNPRMRSEYAHAPDGRGREGLWGRATRGGSPRIHTVPFAPHASVIPSAAARICDLPEPELHGEHFSFIGFRLVRADGRAMPSEPAVGPWLSVAPQILAFEERVVRPAIESMRDQLEFHRVHLHGADEMTPEYRGKHPFDKPTDDLMMTVYGGAAHPTEASEAYPDRALGGDVLLATSMESFRRVLPAHGIFGWCAKYRLGPDATSVLAHPSAAFMMADRKRHSFHARFVATEIDTPTERVTPEMVRDSILAMFRYYEDNADVDRPAPLPAGWLETGKVPGMPWHEEWWTADVR